MKWGYSIRNKGKPSNPWSKAFVVFNTEEECIVHVAACKLTRPELWGHYDVMIFQVKRKGAVT